VLHPRDVLHRNAKHLSEARLRPSLCGTQLGDPASDVAHDLIWAPLSHPDEGPRFGLDEKACDTMWFDRLRGGESS
jgi:hypothetical protein